MTRFTASDWVTFGITAGTVVSAIGVGVLLNRTPKPPEPPKGRLC